MPLLLRHLVLLAFFVLGLSSCNAQDDVCRKPGDEYLTSSQVHDEKGYPRSNQLLMQLFHDVNKFTSAFEVHPLLSKISTSNKGYQYDMHHIPTIFHSGTSTTPSWFSLLEVNDIPTILSQTINEQPLTHGTDYKLVKKVILPPNHEHAGEEYMGMMPKHYYSIQEVLHSFHYKGFSLVIDKMQNRWRNVSDKARDVEDALGVQHVGVNLYLTPEALEDQDGHGGWTDKQVRQGFEAHWDWMDVIVVQLSGRKRWSVAKQPTVYLSTQDQKRKPSKYESAHYFSQTGHYEEFTICPGDVLYIPRGYIHNASTVDFDGLGDLQYDGCDYPEDSTLMQTLKERASGPSLHLTFGLEHECKGTVESLFHHALHAYFGAYDNNKEISACCGITWKSVLHYSIAEVARRKHECDNILSGASGTIKFSTDDCDGNVLLRKSLPLFTSGNAEHVEYMSHLKRTYQKALESFVSLADMRRTLEFVQSTIMQTKEAKLPFCFPGISSRDLDVNIVLCVEELISEVALQYEHAQRVHDFASFASINLETAIQHMNLHREKLQDKTQEEQQVLLGMVGQ